MCKFTFHQLQYIKLTMILQHRKKYVLVKLLELQLIFTTFQLPLITISALLTMSRTHCETHTTPDRATFVFVVAATY